MFLLIFFWDIDSSAVGTRRHCYRRFFSLYSDGDTRSVPLVGYPSRHDLCCLSSSVRGIVLLHIVRICRIPYRILFL